MTDGRSYDPFRKQEPQQPQTAELLWTVRKGTDTQSAELRTLAEADAVRAQLEQDGWIAS